MQLGHYSYYIFWHPGDSCYFAVSPDFPRLSAFGDTPEDALREFQIVLKAAVEIHQEEGWPLPGIDSDDDNPDGDWDGHYVPEYDDPGIAGAVEVAGADGEIFDNDDD